jgi:hypothetical protein
VARRRVMEIQAKLHRRARDDSQRRFDDVFNPVADPAFLVAAIFLDGTQVAGLAQRASALLASAWSLSSPGGY